MYYKNLSVFVVGFLLIHEVVTKKTKRIKRPTAEEEDSSPQPDVVSYSTFGFNDVGTYEGFVPSSPDYAKFLSGANEDSSTKSQNSAYPTSVESPGFIDNFSSPQKFEGQSFTASDNANIQAKLQYQQSSNGFYANANFDNNAGQFKNVPTEEIYGKNQEDLISPVYGTKLSSKGRLKSFNQFNHSDYNVVKIPNNDKPFSNFHEPQTSFDNKPAQGVSNSFPNFPSFPATDNSEYGNTALGDKFKFQRVVDFTKMKPFYTELDTSQLPLATQKPDLFGSPNDTPNVIFDTTQNENRNQFHQSESQIKELYDQKRNEEESEKNYFKSNSYPPKESYNSYPDGTGEKPYNHNSKPNFENKKKPKDRPTWSTDSHDYKKWKDPYNSQKGYEYSTNYSTTNFKYEMDEPKKPHFNNNFDEIVPAGSNFDNPTYQFPETDYSSFKKMPSYQVHEEDEFPNEKNPSFKNYFKYDQSQNSPPKNLFTPAPTSSSFWGNAFPSSEFISYKNHPIKTQSNDFTNDEVVNIPKRPNKWNYDKPFESKPNEWSQFNRRPIKSRPWKDWAKQIPNRFKSEESLLDLRNQDTSHPSYLPTLNSNNQISDDSDYKKLVDKWKQSYLKSKYKESLRDYETYATETKHMHVPIPKPYSIEVPHPVIVPVPQPYPVRVPVAKPVAVPVIQEITVPIEKPVPYPVIKKVPYPIEKLVPVRVEKEVAVPVSKPYPVHIPYVRPVFHHTKTRDEEFRDDDDYFPRTESSKKYVQYRKKKPQSLREHVRKPTRTVYQERSRRRWPERRRPAPAERPPRRPEQQPAPHRHLDYDPEAYGDERDYIRYS